MLKITIGIVAGIVSGLGMGGGTILILILTLFCGVEQHMAQATNFIFFIPTAISAIYMNYKQKLIDIKLSITVGFAGIIGAIIGAIISNNLNTIYLRKIFGLFLGVIAIHEIYKSIKSNKKTKRNT